MKLQKIYPFTLLCLVLFSCLACPGEFLLSFFLYLVQETLAKKLFRRKPSLLLDGWQIFTNLFQWKLAYLDSLLYKENWNKIQLITTYDVQKWKSVKDILVRVMIIALGEWSMLAISTVIQLLETSINRRLMSVQKVRVSFDVMCVFSF